jgi:DNA-directed RNA polymerase subunit RPC12/RpoP
MPALEERTHTRADGRLFGGDERTLDDLVVGALYDASRGDGVACPVCGVPSFSPEGADLLECRSCGSRLEPA